jgi:hypothetical protein
MIFNDYQARTASLSATCVVLETRSASCRLTTRAVLTCSRLDLVCEIGRSYTLALELCGCCTGRAVSRGSVGKLILIALYCQRTNQAFLFPDCYALAMH